MTGSTLAALAASLLSLLFSYIPGFKDWYSPKDPYLKRLIMLALVIVVAMGAFSLAFVFGPRMHAFAGLADDFSIKVSCDAFGTWGLVRAVIAAVAANQAVFLISPRKSYSPSLHSKPRSEPRSKPGFQPGDKRSLRGIDNRK
ncbi:MAG: hypothetical protein WBF05_15150 [Anaerolineales bacterium]